MLTLFLRYSYVGCCCCYGYYQNQIFDWQVVFMIWDLAKFLGMCTLQVYLHRILAILSHTLFWSCTSVICSRPRMTRCFLRLVGTSPRATMTTGMVVTFFIQRHSNSIHRSWCFMNFSCSFFSILAKIPVQHRCSSIQMFFTVSLSNFTASTHHGVDCFILYLVNSTFVVINGLLNLGFHTAHFQCLLLCS